MRQNDDVADDAAGRAAGSGVMDEDDYDRPTPPAVVAAVALGCAPLPIIAVYTVIFLVHGSVHPVQPPDVTSSKEGEFVVGWICLAVFVVATIALMWLLNGRRRWPFVLVELGILALAIDFIVDSTKGGTPVSVLVGVASLLAVICAAAPQAWRHVRRPVPRAVDAVYGWPRRRGTSGAYGGDSGT